MKPVQIVFMGTAELACESLRRLSVDEGSEVVAVVTQPDRPKGRALKLQPTPVKRVALDHGLAVLQPIKARSPEFMEQLAAYKPDLIVVVAYGQMLPKAILNLPRYGCLNVHTSLLPKYRGAAPIQWALLQGDEETGVTIMRMDEGLDTGPIVAVARTPISSLDNSQTLHDRLASLGAHLLLETIPGYVGGTMEAVPQPTEGACYARKITKEDGEIDWSLTAKAVCNRVRGFTPWPGAFTYLRDEPLKMLKIAGVAVMEASHGECGQILRASRQGIVVGCGEGSLEISEVQKEGGRWMPVSEFLAGHRLAEGAYFGRSKTDRAVPCGG